MSYIEKTNKLKKNIKGLVEGGQLEQAKTLLNDYKNIVKNDVEFYTISGVISMLEGNMDSAEKHFQKGLEKEPYNEDLLFNMSYLMNTMKKKRESLETFYKLKFFNVDNITELGDIGLESKMLDKDNLQVVHGTIEIANQMHTISEGLKNQGISSKTINYYPSYLGYKSDYILDINKFTNIESANIETKKLASRLISENDVFHFHFGTTLTLDQSDLAILKDSNKKVIMQYWGSDVRLYSKAKKINKYAIVKEKDENKIKRKLEFLSNYIDHCLVDYELAEYVKGYHSNIHYIRQAIDLKKYEFIEKTNNERPLLVHAPTSPEFKGTRFILAAIEELKEKYDFDFKLVQGVSHDEAIKIYKKADLIIDQLLAGSHGLFAVEAMAMGKPVICWISDFMKEKYPKELPIISANPDNIKKKIEHLLKNREILSNIGVKGRNYAERYHASSIISNNILEIYKKI